MKPTPITGRAIDHDLIRTAAYHTLNALAGGDPATIETAIWDFVWSKEQATTGLMRPNIINIIRSNRRDEIGLQAAECRTRCNKEDQRLQRMDRAALVAELRAYETSGLLKDVA